MLLVSAENYEHCKKAFREGDISDFNAWDPQLGPQRHYENSADFCWLQIKTGNDTLLMLLRVDEKSRFLKEV